MKILLSISFTLFFIEQCTAGQCGSEQMISVDATKNKMSNFKLPFSLVLVTKFDVLFFCLKMTCNSNFIWSSASKDFFKNQLYSIWDRFT